MGMAKHETTRHREAFELYIALGEERSHAEVARRVGVDQSSVNMWSRAFGWQKRLEQREKLINEVISQKAVEDETKRRSDALKICRAAIYHFASTLRPRKDKDGNEIPAPAEVKAGDFVSLVKLEQLLMGKSTDRAELMVGGPTFEKLIDAMVEIIEREVSDPAIRARIGEGFKQVSSEIDVGHA